MQFSVIMPVYNRRFFVGRAIRSVADQDCVDRSEMEILVVDDGSTDGSLEEIQGIDVKPVTLRVFAQPHTGEPGTTRNVALRHARGEYIAYCDSDDFWLPHHLATAMQEFKKDPELELVANYWGLAQFVLRGREIENRIVVPPHPKWAVNTNCRVHRRNCLDKIGHFNRSRWGEDYDFFTAMEKACKNTKTGTVTSVNGYIKSGNNLTYESDPGVRARYM